MDKIKKVIRSGIVETNSSSSHSICICMRGDLVENWGDLDIRGNVLYIPCHEDFGREYFKTNKCSEKLVYLCALICSSYHDYNKVLCQVLERVLKSFLGISRVVYEWNVLKCDPPLVDYNSIDLLKEVMESRDTMVNFIFNPKSWLYGGSDEYSGPDSFRHEVIDSQDDILEAVGSVELGGIIGRVDFDIPNINRLSLSLQYRGSIFSGISWDIEKNDFVVFHSRISDAPVNLLSTSRILLIGEEYYLVYFNYHKIQSELEDKFGKDTSIYALQKFIENIDLFREGIDYKKFKLDIKLLEFEYV